MNESRSLVSSDVRFQFGKNWSRFLKTIDDERIIIAIESLKSMLEIKDLNGKRFLDIGSGSGLFSLAARRLGAYVHSFDYDLNSVACTAELQRRYFPNDSKWHIEQGSVLDADYLHSLGKFDIVYAWGVLHHTGEMWQALANASIAVADRGKLYIAIYNDQGGKSRRWRVVKRLYCSSLIGKTIIIGVFFPFFFFKGLIVDIILGRNPMRRYKEHKKNRGMSLFRDWFDWLGGYPFEVAKPEEIFDFYNERGYRLERLKTCGGGLGNNQFVFLKNE
jgi:2-polyprenyl-6-hydroxyphenyl methylase/3-demethylubiquinone-9 3-methyltransferase